MCNKWDQLLFLIFSIRFTELGGNSGGEVDINVFKTQLFNG